jgi:hypothetical protein
MFQFAWFEQLFKEKKGISKFGFPNKLMQKFDNYPSPQSGHVV